MVALTVVMRTWSDAVIAETVAEPDVARLPTVTVPVTLSAPVEVMSPVTVMGPDMTGFVSVLLARVCGMLVLTSVSADVVLGMDRSPAPDP